MIDILVDDRPASRYAEEIVSAAGLAWRRIDPGDLGPAARLGSTVLLVGDGALNVDAREVLCQHVESGGALITTGGTWGLDDLLGATGTAGDEGYVRIDQPGHLITADLPVHLHVWSATTLCATTGRALATALATDHDTLLGDAIVTHRSGPGATVAIGANIAASVLHIQLGAPIHADGVPAADGSGPIDDGILKTDDGVVLSWEHDRRQTPLAAPVPDCPGKDPAYPDGDTPWFAEPLADALRTVLVNALTWAATTAGHPVASIAAWPHALPAVGMISHDSDHNVDLGARVTLDLLARAGITSTWCHLWSPHYTQGYAPETFDLIKRAGHEIALHYNARPEEDCAWGRRHLADQAARVRTEARVDAFVSNKNHYLRWEGLVEMFHWLADEGIAVDQSKGPSKHGNVGFAHGSCLPWFPLDPATGDWIDVLEIPVQFQDLWLTTPEYVGRHAIERAVRYHGVAHFLFHQAHLHTRPEVAQAMLDIVADGREAGLAWWRSEEINAWQRLHRAITVDAQGGGAEVIEIRVTTPQPVAGATITVALPQADDARPIRVTSEASLAVTITSRDEGSHVTCVADLPSGESRIGLRRD